MTVPQRGYKEWTFILDIAVSALLRHKESCLALSYYLKDYLLEAMSL